MVERLVVLALAVLLLLTNSQQAEAHTRAPTVKELAAMGLQAHALQVGGLELIWQFLSGYRR